MRRTYQNQTCQYQHQNTQVWTEAHLWTLKRREAGGSSIDMEICSVWFANSWATGALTQWSSVLDEGRQCMIYCVMFGSNLWVLRVLWQLQPWTDEWRWPIDALHQKWLLLSSCSAWKYLAHNPFYATANFMRCVIRYVSILALGTIIFSDQSSHDGGILGPIILFC